MFGTWFGSELRARVFMDVPQQQLVDMSKQMFTKSLRDLNLDPDRKDTITYCRGV